MAIGNQLLQTELNVIRTFLIIEYGTVKLIKLNRFDRLLWIDLLKSLFILTFFEGASIVKIIYDKEVDALSIIFQETTVTTQHLAEGIAVDYNQSGHLAGIEILDASQQFGGMETIRQVMLENIELVGDYQRKVV